MTVKVSLKGMGQLKEALKEKGSALREGAPKIVGTVALDLLGKAVRMAPVDSGDLRGSGNAVVNGSEIGRGTASGAVTGSPGMAGSATSERIEGVVQFATPYAVKQHEDRTLNHPKGGRAKYLEQPFLTEKSRYRQYMADEARKLIEQ